MKKEEIIEKVEKARPARISKKVKITMVCDCCNQEYKPTFFEEKCEWCERDFCRGCGFVVDWPGNRDSQLVLCKDCDSNYGEAFMDECNPIIKEAFYKTENIALKYSKLAKDKRNKKNG